MKRALSIAAALALGATTLVQAAPDGGEREARRAQMLERLRAADTNGDGLLSRTEAAALPRLADKFDAIDANKDGQVSFDELKAARGKHGRHGHGAKMFQRADTDGDGKVSKAEATAQVDAMFARVDANGDGFITPEEARAAHPKHGKR